MDLFDDDKQNSTMDICTPDRMSPAQYPLPNGLHPFPTPRSLHKIKEEDEEDTQTIQMSSCSSLGLSDYCTLQMSSQPSVDDPSPEDFPTVQMSSQPSAVEYEEHSTVQMCSQSSASETGEADATVQALSRPSQDFRTLGIGKSAPVITRI